MVFFYIACWDPVLAGCTCSVPAEHWLPQDKPTNPGASWQRCNGDDSNRVHACASALISTLGMSDRDSYFYAAIVAVVTVHVVLALFVYVAWNEGSRQWREGKQD
uniref:Uncharacterized protein n=1 Tax=Accipiter nisus TaxID=211598 RepID=A0A8B9M8T8_9AVES